MLTSQMLAAELTDERLQRFPVLTGFREGWDL